MSKRKNGKAKGKGPPSKSAKRVAAIKEAFFMVIGIFASNIKEYVFSPEKDFTRHRTLFFEPLMSFMLHLQSLNISGELADFFGLSADTPSESAVLMQRAKLQLQLFIDFFHMMTRKFDEVLSGSQDDNRVRIMAFDGTDAAAPSIEDCTDERKKPPKDKHKVNGKHKTFSINAFFEIGSQLFHDIRIQEGDGNERAQAIDMIKNSWFKKAIVLMDRGYESWEMMAQCVLKGWNFVIRAKDIASNGICSALDLPSDNTFDVTIHMTLLNRQTNVIKCLIDAFPNNFKYISWSTFSLFPQNPKLSQDYSLHVFQLVFRIVRIEIKPGIYEILFTNLPADEYPPERLKKLYWKRWNIEIGFRRVKYLVDLVRIHSRKTFYIMQELYCRFIVYNMAVALRNVTEIPESKRKNGRKHQQQIKFTAAVRSARSLILGNDPNNIAGYLAKHLEPIINDRTFERNKYPRSTHPFNSRSAG